MRLCLSKRILLSASLLAVLAGSPPARADDTVVLTDGTRLRGKVVEDPRGGVTLTLPDGATRRLQPSQVKRVVHGGGIGAAATPAREAEGSDTVVLADGTEVRGTVAEEDPKAGVSLVRPGGEVKRFKPSEVKRVIYGGGLPPRAPTPAAAPAPPPIEPPSACEDDDACQRGSRCVGGQCRPTDERRRGGRGVTGIWVGGLTLWLTTYVADLITTAIITASVPEARWTSFGMSFVPLVGPFMQIGLGVARHDATPLQLGLLTASGALQGAGFTLFIAGLRARRSEGDDDVRAAAARAAPRWSLLPSVGPKSAGLTFTVSGL
jgi:hypothetical protein